jgi:hypothetical protein
MFWAIAFSLIGGIAIGWTFPQPEWVAKAWASFKDKWLK